MAAAAGGQSAACRHHPKVAAGHQPRRVVVPVAALFPLKVLELWLLAHKYWIAAGEVLVFAKLVGVAVTAFVFEVTRPGSCWLRWFRWLYGPS